jgi:hypothetical protein
MDERGRVQGVRAVFSGEENSRESTQFVIDERHQACRWIRVAAAPIVQNPCDFMLKFDAILWPRPLRRGAILARKLFVSIKLSPAMSVFDARSRVSL